MLHEVRLPQITLARLTDVVVLQIWLLFYAASKTSLGPGDKQDCANKLDKCPRFSGRGSKIADWIWGANAAKLGPLKKLAQDSTVTSSEKKKGIQRLSRDAFGLLKNANSPIEPFKGTEPWQIATSDFFINLYEKVLRQSPKTFQTPPRLTQVVIGFPPFIFSDPHASQFGAQEFLRAFFEENKSNLTICPACDEAPYSISAGRVYVNTGDRKIEADIDHYLPKSSYPHLACHPYNLVPNCPFCNQRKKKDKDPLSRYVSGISSRRTLNDIHQIYREKGLVKSTYLEVDFSNSFKAPRIITLKPKSGCNVREALFSLEEVYQIPAGWQEPSETEAEILFNRLQAFLDSHDSPFDSLEVIDWLDAYLFSILEEWGRQAYAVLKVWLLVQHINETNSVFDSSGRKIRNTAFLQELELLCGIQNSAYSTHLLSKPTVRDRFQQARDWRESLVT